MHRVVAVAVAAALVALAMWGCGGSGGDPTTGAAEEFTVRAATTMTTADKQTKAKFLRQVNALCRRKWKYVLNAVKQTSVLWRKQYPHIDPQKNYVRSIHVSFYASIDFLIFDWIRRVSAPPSEKRRVEEVIGSMQEAIERGQRVVRVKSVAQLEQLFADYNREARSYGLDGCLIGGARLPRPET